LNQDLTRAIEALVGSSLNFFSLYFFGSPDCSDGDKKSPPVNSVIKIDENAKQAVSRYQIVFHIIHKLLTKGKHESLF